MIRCICTDSPNVMKVDRKKFCTIYGAGISHSCTLHKHILNLMVKDLLAFSNKEKFKIGQLFHKISVLK